MAELKRILLAEDDPHDVELTLAALEEHKVVNQVEVVTDGQEALDYLFREGIYADRPMGGLAAVLLDIKMPKVDGIEVLRRIKADPILRRVPVVMLTSSREQSDLIRSYDLGVNAYVVKPLDFHAFVDAVKDVGAFWGMLNEAPPETR
jgi:CheY-like chemotaxis protein